MKSTLAILWLTAVGSLASARAYGHQEGHKDDQDAPRITVAELLAKLDKQAPIVIVDSRSEGSWEGSDKQIKGSVRIPIDQIESRMTELPKDKEIVIYCS